MGKLWQIEYRLPIFCILSQTQLTFLIQLSINFYVAIYQYDATANYNKIIGKRWLICQTPIANKPAVHKFIIAILLL